MSSDPFHRIQSRAYQKWEKAGRPEGKAEEHWLAAEREIEDETRSGDGLPVAEDTAAGEH